MPNVGGKKFPYTAAGMRAARNYRRSRRGPSMGSPRMAGGISRPGAPMRGGMSRPGSRRPARTGRPMRPVRRRGGY